MPEKTTRGRREDGFAPVSRCIYAASNSILFFLFFSFFFFFLFSSVSVSCLYFISLAANRMNEWTEVEKKFQALHDFGSRISVSALVSLSYSILLA